MEAQHIAGLGTGSVDSTCCNDLLNLTCRNLLILTCRKDLLILSHVPALLLALRAAHNHIVTAGRVRLHLNVVHTQVALHPEPAAVHTQSTCVFKHRQDTCMHTHTHARTTHTHL